MSQDRSHTVKTYSLKDAYLHLTPAEAAVVDQLSDMRADRDSLRDALLELVQMVEDKVPGWALNRGEWEAIESARHVLGSKRA